MLKSCQREKRVKEAVSMWPYTPDSAETFGFLASPCGARSYNRRISGFAMLRPNSPFGRTSDMRQTLYEIPPFSPMEKEIT
jgi:hypothetical protein